MVQHDLPAAPQLSPRLLSRSVAPSISASVRLSLRALGTSYVFLPLNILDNTYRLISYIYCCSRMRPRDDRSPSPKPGGSSVSDGSPSAPTPARYKTSPESRKAYALQECVLV